MPSSLDEDLERWRRSQPDWRHRGYLPEVERQRWELMRDHLMKAIADIDELLGKVPVRAWICTNHEGHYTVGVASVVMAATEEEARALLVKELLDHGLEQDPGKLDMVPLDITASGAYVLNDGNY